MNNNHINDGMPELSATVTETKPAEKQLTPNQIFRRQLTQYEKTIVKLIGNSGFSPEKFMAVVENSIRKTPSLLNCDRQSLFASILTAAEFGLEPNTPAQHCYIIPYKNEATFQFGYHGITHLLYRNPRILKIFTEIVFKNDQFDRWIDESMNWKFIFRPAEGDRGALKGIFAVAHIDGTDPEFKYMTLEELNQIKAKSKKPDLYSIENDPQRWMYRKAVVKQIAKLLPKNTIIERALTMDSQIEGGASLTVDERGTVIIADKPQNISRKKLSTIFNVTDVEPQNN